MEEERKVTFLQMVYYGAGTEPGEPEMYNRKESEDQLPLDSQAWWTEGFQV